MAFVNLPANLQDIFGSITDRIAKLETGPNQALYTADTANVNAIQALNEATQALAQATIAYNVSSQALIKDANTITNSTNNLTGINGNGITVYSGASATSGSRVVLNSAGIAGYNSANDATFAIAASTGNVSIQGASFTNGTIYGGSLNINGNTIIDTAGKLTSIQGVFTGSITAYSGSFAGSVTATSGAIGGFNLGTTYLSTNNGSSGYRISTDGRAVFGFLTADTAGITSGLTLSSGTCTVSAGGNAFNNVGALGATSVTTTGLISAGGELYAAGKTSTTNTANGVVFATGGRVTNSTASSARFKENIVNLVDIPEYDPKKLLNIPIRAFTYKTDYLTHNDDRSEILIPGFIAEEIDAIYPIAVDYNDGQAETWNERILIPGLLALIQNQEERIKALENK
jgi:hypothetical protein